MRALELVRQWALMPAGRVNRPVANFQVLPQKHAPTTSTKSRSNTPRPPGRAIWPRDSSSTVSYPFPGAQPLPLTFSAFIWANCVQTTSVKFLLVVMCSPSPAPVQPGRVRAPACDSVEQLGPLRPKRWLACGPGPVFFFAGVGGATVTNVRPDDQALARGRRQHFPLPGQPQRGVAERRPPPRPRPITRSCTGRRRPGPRTSSADVLR